MVLLLFFPLYLSASLPVIQAGTEYGYPPYCLVDSDGEADGFSIDLLTASLEVMGYDVQFTIDTWQTVQSQLANGDIEVLPLMSRNPDREETFDFTFPYITMNGTYIVHEDSEMPETSKDLIGLRIGVMKGDSSEDYVRNLDIEYYYHG